MGKITGKEGLVFQGPARVFDCEEDMLAALSENPDSMKARPSALMLAMLSTQASVARSCLLDVCCSPGPSRVMRA